MLKALLLGLVFAVVGFSYSLATTSRSLDGPAESRAGGALRTPLRFTNPLVSSTTERDLGDAAFGSQIIRFVQARGGFPPRRFTSDKLNSDFAGNVSLSEAIAGLPVANEPNKSTAIMNLTGRLTGVLGGNSAFSGPDLPMTFDVTVTDSRGTNPNKVTEPYRITMVDSNTFKFAQSAFSDGVAFRHYRDRIEVIAGNAPYTFSASNITVTDETTGAVRNVATFEELGLFFSPTTGKLVGRPIVTGRISFQVQCRDVLGNMALSRDKSATGQVLSFRVEDNPRVSTELFATSITIKGDVSNAGKDSIDYTGVVNVDGTSLSKMAGAAVKLQIADYETPVVILDDKGKGSTVRSRTDATVSVSISSAGQIKVSVRNESFGKRGRIVDAGDLVSSLQILPVSLEIGDFFETSELLKFQQKAKSSVFQETYKFGPGNLGGGFLITSVLGKDDTKGSAEADAWKVQFIALPPNERRISSAATASVGIGTNFSDTINVVDKNGGVVSTQKRDASQPVVTKLALSAKGKGSVTTGFLPRLSTQPDTNTDIPAALSAGGKRTRFPFIMTINAADGRTVFGVEGSRAIFPRGDTWISKDLTR